MNTMELKCRSCGASLPFDIQDQIPPYHITCQYCSTTVLIKYNPNHPCEKVILKIRKLRQKIQENDAQIKNLEADIAERERQIQNARPAYDNRMNTACMKAAAIYGLCALPALLLFGYSCRQFPDNGTLRAFFLVLGIGIFAFLCRQFWDKLKRYHSDISALKNEFRNALEDRKDQMRAENRDKQKQLDKLKEEQKKLRNTENAFQLPEVIRSDAAMDALLEIAKGAPHITLSTAVALYQERLRNEKQRELEKEERRKRELEKEEQMKAKDEQMKAQEARIKEQEEKMKEQEAKMKEMHARLHDLESKQTEQNEHKDQKP